MNIFLNPEIAARYDEYYGTEQGRKIDYIEKQIIAGFLENVPKNEILELGCGTGHWTEFFENMGFQVTGVDASEPMLNKAKLKKLSASFLAANAEHLPINNESFSVIASITMLEFVDNQALAIQEMHRVLKKGGHLILGCLNADSVIGKNKDQDEVFRNANLLKLEEWKSLLKSFELLEVKSGVYLSDDYQIMDDSKNIHDFDPAFIGLLLKKI